MFAHAPKRLLLIAACIASQAVSGRAEDSDLAAAQDIAQAFRDGGMKSYSVRVGYKDGEVTLTGSVANLEQWARATQIAKRRPRVVKVVNNLEIRPIDGAGDTVTSVFRSIGVAAIASAPTMAMEVITKTPAALPQLLVLACNVLPAEPPDRFDVELADGSKLAAATVTLRRIVLETELGRLTVPLRVVKSLKFGSDAKMATVHLRNGDVVSGSVLQIDGPTVRLKTLYAKVNVKPEAIREVSLSGQD